MRDELSVGLAQWLPVPGMADRNLATALDLIRQLAADGCDVIALPELWPCGYEPSTLAADAARAAEPLDGPRARSLAEAARDAGVWLFAGSVPERTDDAIHNTAPVFGPSGDLIAWHRKAHLYGDHERNAFAPGDRLTSFETDDLGVVGLCVCFDGDLPEVARAMGDAGARLIVSPCAYEVDAATWWDRLYPAHAMVNGQWWVMPNQAGANAGVTFLGGSRIVSPLGEIVAEASRVDRGGSSEPEALVSRIAFAHGLAAADTQLGALRSERRPDIYGGMTNVGT
jgi:predicted amidohydrolase